MKEYKKFAIDFAKWSGKVIRSNFSYGMAKVAKADGSPVTKTDLAINKELIKQIRKLFPTHGILGEEASFIKKDSEFVWVCDPVDGTIPFSHGIPICTFSLALVKNGKSILGVAYNPFEDNLFFAEHKKGATLNGKTIHVSNFSTLKTRLGEYETFQTSKYDTTQLAKYLIDKEGAHLIKLCSYVYPSTLVALGEVAYTIFPHTTPYDVAAVKIIVEEAGGKVTDMFGKEQRYDRELDGAIVSNGKLHSKLVSLAKKFVKRNENRN